MECELIENYQHDINLPNPSERQHYELHLPKSTQSPDLIVMKSSVTGGLTSKIDDSQQDTLQTSYNRRETPEGFTVAHNPENNSNQLDFISESETSFLSPIPNKHFELGTLTLFQCKPIIENSVRNVKSSSDFLTDINYEKLMINQSKCYTPNVCISQKLSSDSLKKLAGQARGSCGLIYRITEYAELSSTVVNHGSFISSPDPEDEAHTLSNPHLLDNNFLRCQSPLNCLDVDILEDLESDEDLVKCNVNTNSSKSSLNDVNVCDNTDIFNLKPTSVNPSQSMTKIQNHADNVLKATKASEKRLRQHLDTLWNTVGKGVNVSETMNFVNDKRLQSKASEPCCRTTQTFKSNDIDCRTAVNDVSNEANIPANNKDEQHKKNCQLFNNQVVQKIFNSYFLMVSVSVKYSNNYSAITTVTPLNENINNEDGFNAELESFRSSIVMDENYEKEALTHHNVYQLDESLTTNKVSVSVSHSETKVNDHKMSVTNEESISNNFLVTAEDKLLSNGMDRQLSNNYPSTLTSGICISTRFPDHKHYTTSNIGSNKLPEYIPSVYSNLSKTDSIPKCRTVFSHMDISSMKQDVVNETKIDKTENRNLQRISHMHEASTTVAFNTRILSDLSHCLVEVNRLIYFVLLQTMIPW
ncbi:hypothetical protein EWB00_001208 [Schistosoma japonicum]|uniref:Uncharacterized protein n=1 Tax=Schistosoma japonicum TaxID=6182 RepID=A0A4Z2DGE9_SCHJA|nr:hypothetical protein EWB00_001208 [Schistosoma japonicum]